MGENGVSSKIQVFKELSSPDESSGSGDITLWDLNNGGRIAGILRGAHRVSSGEKTIVTST
jgi:hypothetical protein